MAWDVSLPADSEAVSAGAGRIRTFKTDIATALTDEGLFPGATPATPVFRYRGGKGATGSRPTAGTGGLYFDTTRNALQRDNGSTWDDVGTVIPAGTKVLFFQAAAPVGWTQDTANNDKALRVVSGSGGGTGGSTAFSSVWAASTTGAEASHTHGYGTLSAPGPVSSVSVPNGSDQSVAKNDHGHSLTGATDTGSSHSHATPAYAPHYIDVIVCAKD